jgi:hypothetical protein
VLLERFGSVIFEYLKTIVPYWRICDEAWHVTEDPYLGGIGVERNYGGQLLVIPSQPRRRSRRSCSWAPAPMEASQ